MTVRPHGVVVPVVTPLEADESLNEPVLRDFLDALIPEVDGVFVLGSSGEATSLPDATAVRVAAATVDHVSARVPVYVGVGDTSLQRSLARVELLSTVRADLMVVAPPYYYPVSEAGLVSYFERIADVSPRPILLYNIPQNTHNLLTLPVVRALASHPRIVGIKDSTGDPFLFAQILRLRTDGFSVLQGREQLLRSSIWAGADGSISALANVAPRLLRETAASADDPDCRARSLDLQDEIDDVARLFEQGYWLSAMKVALQERGWDVGEPAQPVAPLDASQRAVVRQILSGTDDRWLIPRRGADPARLEVGGS